MKSIGETIRNLRRERDITQESLASMLGVTSQSVSQWENGRTLPDISLLAPPSGPCEEHKGSRAHSDELQRLYA